ncbi:MAG: primosomal protein N' [Bacilli bacterium]|nr:primosomal protein N' [Bacilli bacterium]
MVAGVLVEITNKNVDRIFEYNVPSTLEENVKIGVRVLVPFGKMMLEGFVCTLSDKKETDKELKEVDSIIDTDIVLNDELLNLGKWMQKETVASLMSCYQVMLPKALKAKNGSVVSIRYDTYYKLKNDSIMSEQFSGKQKEIVLLLKEKGLVLRKELFDISSSSLNTLLKHGVLEKIEKEHYRVSYESGKIEKKELTTMQKEAVDAVINSSPKTFLLHGVTGSGKTEVYMEIIDYYLKLGKKSIVLVPEISLTPQMVDRFRRRFGDKIAALHSALSDGEKYDEWRRICRGEASIVIGARSAIFAPLDDIGIIIIDEEHSDSYKQSDPSPRYHARDVAIYRAKTHNCSVVLGSATPSLESMARVQKRVYEYLSLPERINGKSLPEVTIIDMNNAMKKSRGHFSNELISAIDDRLQKKEQVILLLNRRGYSSFVMCKNCGYTFKCPNCDITLTYHKTSNTLRCHYCGYGDKEPSICPSCGEKSLNNLGVGTEKIEEELQKLFPSSKILRMDYDTTSRKGMHEEMISKFKNHEYDILLGTQMVAKGLDFSLVTLVGVINADTSLNIPDFRSSENTFSLLSQVAGRSGRAEKIGSVVIQTYNPDHYSISYVKNHNYFGFYKREMEIRKQLKYPPYYYLCNLRVCGKNQEYLLGEALKIKRSLERNLDSVMILGPSVGNTFKINNTYHYNIILKYKNKDVLYDIFEKIIEHYKTNIKIKIDIDFNPSQIL